ncbi:ribosome maturation factor RimP [Frankia sp. AgB1.9]|uniref:ribosome maturation factor RimP n=1 Tax=unclassified Frankia TaxID=2632575 RepID=UPI00193344EC|nr:MULTISPECIES: ribosome maturation factor RimP [unclassified Frankia]MBL7488974.1 ribosome maturation factor RimP [Frankia sp. AgW1.1]MBL7546856.1 ribosome maturation factor RimP [Frankia sp. AgB1.9]MBL7622526.1 ribosome maturation factor RimP [Frankia sp. AgB1.8]
MARDASGRTGHRPQTSGSAPPAEIRDRLAEALAQAGFDLDDLSLSRAGSRSVLRVAVDRDDGIDLDAVADASRLISELLDQVDERGLAGAYVLEVTSPGVDRPLTEPRHWRRARGRLVEARRVDGAVVLGRVLGADDEGVDLAVAAGSARRGRPVKTKLERLRFADVARAVVQIEFGPAGGESADAGAADAGPAATDADVDLAEDDGAGFEDAAEVGDELDDGWADDDGAADLDELDVADDQHGADDPGDARRAPTAGRRKDVGGSPGEETDR